MEITSLKIKNFLSLSDVEIRPGKVTQIVGGNNQGKTSILKALTFAVKGSNDPSLVKFGEDQAEVLVELSDNTSIRRRINSEGRQSVEVKREGMKAQAPQSFLDALFDQSSFNPLELLNPKQRTEAILKSIDVKVTPEFIAKEIDTTQDNLPPVNWADHGLKVVDAIYRYMYQRRAEANRAALEKRKRWETYNRDLPAIGQEPQLSVSEIAQQREELKSIIHKHEIKLSEIDILSKQAQQREAKIADFKLAVEAGANTIAELENKLAAARARHESAIEFYEKAKLELSTDVPSKEPIEQQIRRQKELIHNLDLMQKDWERIDAVKRQHRQVEDLKEEVTDAETFANSLDIKVNSLYGPVKEKIMSMAEMPVKGLEYRDGEFYINDVRVDNLSTSASIRLAVAVARKLAKKTKIICIDGAEQLDEDSFNAFIDETRDDGFTYFVTKVGTPFSSISDLSDQVVVMKKSEALQ